MHDNTLNRTLDCGTANQENLEVSNYSFSLIDTHCVIKGSSREMKMPLLSEALEVLKKSSTKLILDIKEHESWKLKIIIDTIASLDKNNQCSQSKPIPRL